MNVVNVWLSGYTGKGIVVSILDDGIENTHPDLIDNYVSANEYHRNAYNSLIHCATESFFKGQGFMCMYNSKKNVYYFVFLS